MSQVVEMAHSNVNTEENVGTEMRHRIAELSDRSQVTDGIAQFFYDKFKAIAQQENLGRNASQNELAKFFQDTKREYEERTKAMQGIANDTYSLVLEQEQYLDGQTRMLDEPDEESRQAEVNRLQRRIEELERENFNLKTKLEHVKSLYMEAKNMNERFMSSIQTKAPVQVEEDITILENIKQQLNDTMEEKAELEKVNWKLTNQLRKAEMDISLAKNEQQKAALEVCWTIIDSLRTYGVLTHHDVAAVLSHGNLTVYS